MMFKDINGKLSAKRVNAFICIIAGIVIGIISVFKNAGAEYMISAFVAGAAMLGVTIGEKPKGNNGE